MCGIFCALSTQSINAQDYESAFYSLKHRGPDNSSILSIDNGVIFGHHRLSIVDISDRANQPLESECGRYSIVFNGEIYNHQTLRAKLRDHCSFKTTSDTEVILAAYSVWGQDMITKLDGMFAFAIWDRKKKTLFAARDRSGQKPLYYSKIGDSLFIASELRAIKLCSEKSLDIDRDAFSRFLISGMFYSSETPYKNVKKLSPGCFMEFSDGSITIIPYFNYLKKRQTGLIFNEKDALERLDLAISNSLRNSVPTEADYCLFLSGGIDSSLLLSYLNEIDIVPKTYSLIMPGNGYSELDSITRICSVKKSIHTSIEFSFDKFAKVFSKACNHMDEPHGDIGYINAYYLASQVADNGIKVALTGDGGDELFRGYLSYSGTAIASLLKNETISSLLLKFTKILPSSYEYMNLRTKMGSFLRARGLIPSMIPFAWMSTLDPSDVSELFNKRVNFLNLFSPYDTKENNIANALDSYYWQYFLPEHTCSHTDRASMSFGIETRSPLLNNEIIELASIIDSSLKFKSFQSKYILRKLALKKGIPSKIAFGKKKGFAFPFKQILNINLKREVESTILDNNNLFTELNINRDKTIQILSNQFSNKSDNTRLIFSLYTTSKFFQK